MVDAYVMPKRRIRSASAIKRHVTKGLSRNPLGKRAHQVRVRTSGLNAMGARVSTVKRTNDPQAAIRQWARRNRMV